MHSKAESFLSLGAAELVSQDSPGSKPMSPCNVVLLTGRLRPPIVDLQPHCQRKPPHTPLERDNRAVKGHL